jgi:hypothetical protein
MVVLSLASLGLSACGSFEEKRVRELMNEKGFGSRAEGDATVENYVAGGDVITFILSPPAYQDASSERLLLLMQPQPVTIDGKILIPYVGPVEVLGKTEAELASLVKSLLRPVFKFELDLQARIMFDNKNIYAFGEVGRKGVIPIRALGGSDLTLLKSVALIGWTALANLGRVYLIRPDAEHPLVVEVNFHEMITTGYTARNFRIRENDIVYIPPTFLGMIARILERLFAPLAVATRALWGVANIRMAYDYAYNGSNNSIFLRF